MHIWVDADACPRPIKEILYRAAEKRAVQVTLVANKIHRIPNCRFLDFVVVLEGYDVADHEIVKRLAPNDLVITADINLAAVVIDHGGLALNPRGTRYSPDNISERVAVRNLLDELRHSGVMTGGPATFDDRDKQAFANQLDRLLTKYHEGGQADRASSESTQEN